MKNNINTKRKFQIINATLPQVLIHSVMARVVYIAWALKSELHLPVTGRLGTRLCARFVKWMCVKGALWGTPVNTLIQ